MGPKMLIEVDGKILFIVRMPRLCSVVLGGLKMTTKKQTQKNGPHSAFSHVKGI